MAPASRWRPETSLAVTVTVLTAPVAPACKAIRSGAGELVVVVIAAFRAAIDDAAIDDAERLASQHQRPAQRGLMGLH